MNKLTLALASGALALAAPLTPAFATIETAEARSAAAEAATMARNDMYDVFGDKELDPGEYVWNENAASSGTPRLVISLSDQLAYLYRGDQHGEQPDPDRHLPDPRQEEGPFLEQI